MRLRKLFFGLSVFASVFGTSGTFGDVQAAKPNRTTPEANLIDNLFIVPQIIYHNHIFGHLRSR